MKRNKNSSAMYWIGSVVIILIIGVLLWAIIPGVTNTGDFSIETATSGEIDEILNGFEYEMNEAVLKEARETMKYLVLEQDCSIEQTISDTWFGWDIFKKTKSIICAGTGFFAVDLEEVSAENVDIDNDNFAVTISIPKPYLDHVRVDPSKTVFQKTDNGLMRFGDIKLTVEQQAVITDKAETAMTELLTSKECLASANSSAKLQVKKLLEPIVKAVNDQYGLIVEILD